MCICYLYFIFVYFIEINHFIFLFYLIYFYFIVCLITACIHMQDFQNTQYFVDLLSLKFFVNIQYEFSQCKPLVLLFNLKSNVWTNLIGMILLQGYSFQGNMSESFILFFIFSFFKNVS